MYLGVVEGITMGKGSLIKIGLWARLLEDFKLLYWLLKDYWKGEYRDISVWSILVFAAGIIYVLSPFDILPDFIPLVGQVDDAMVLIFCIFFLEKDLHKYREWKIRNPGARKK